jgi:hypothetical protein
VPASRDAPPRPRFSDTQFRELPRDGFAQSPSQLADGEGARHDQDAHAISLLDHLELAHLPVARHDSELEGMDHHLVPVPGREEQHVAGATFYGARADQGSSARAGLGIERDGVRHFQADVGCTRLWKLVTSASSTFSTSVTYSKTCIP